MLLGAPVAGALVVELLLQLLLQLLRLLQRGDERLGARRAAGALVDRPQPLLPLGLAQLQPLVDAAAAAMVAIRLPPTGGSSGLPPPPPRGCREPGRDELLLPAPMP